MTDEGLISVIVSSGHGRTAWADGLSVTVPATLAEAARNGADVPQEIAAAAIDRVRLSAAYTDRKPASSRMPFSYQIVPLAVRSSIGHIMGRVQRGRSGSWAAFPRFPVDLSADFVADLCGGPLSPYVNRPAPVLLSHDIDSAEGLRNVVGRFLTAEESVGARSANYIVPCAWKIDDSLLEEICRRGHEVGIHGYDHSNLTPFAEPEERRRRIEAAKPLVERYGIIGYRAPSLVRTRALLRDLARVYRYDSSIPTSGGLFPVPNNGCASARPFFVGDLVEIPLSLPRDGSLMFLGYRPDEIFAMWRDCAERIAASGGVVSLLTHCEGRFSGSPAMFELYRRFLDYLATDGRYEFLTPMQILDDVKVAAA